MTFPGSKTCVPSCARSLIACLRIAALFCFFLLPLSTTAHADTVITYLATGTDPGNHALDSLVSLDFNPSANLITASVTNLVSDQNSQMLKDDGQLIVDFSFEMDVKLGNLSVTQQSAPYGYVNLSAGLNPAQHGSITPDWNPVFTAGGSYPNFDTTITLCDNPGAPNCSGQWVGGGGQHQQMIIGEGAGANALNYSGANSSLRNANKNPDIFETAVFRISATGLPTNLSQADLSSVTVYFGTGTSPQSVAATFQSDVSTVPEPSPVIFALIGFILVGLTRKLRRQR